jgi:hypothetical protein
MHTSTRLCAGDFHFRRQGLQDGKEGSQEVDFALFSPNYHEQDRIGVVSLGLEDGVLNTSYALLAFTTAFYDRLRARGKEFFDYPQHFAFVGTDKSKAGNSRPNAWGAVVHAGSDLLPAETPQLWNAWSWLDVWPDAKWVTAPATAAGMLQRAFDYQINRLFWPRALNLEQQESQLPAHLWKMLKSSLKAVYLYGEGNGAMAGLAGDCFEVRVLAAAQEIVQESVVQLPAPLLIARAAAITQAPTAPQVYERVAVEEFLAALQGDLS